MLNKKKNFLKTGYSPEKNLYNLKTNTVLDIHVILWKKIKLLKELMLSITSEERESGRMKKTNTGKFKVFGK